MLYGIVEQPFCKSLAVNAEAREAAPTSRDTQALDLLFTNGVPGVLAEAIEMANATSRHLGMMRP